MFYRNDKYIYFALIPISSLLHCFAFYTLHCNKTKLYRHFRFGLNSTTRRSEVQFNFIEEEKIFFFFLFPSSCKENRTNLQKVVFFGIIKVFICYLYTNTQWFFLPLKPPFFAFYTSRWQI